MMPNGPVEIFVWRSSARMSKINPSRYHHHPPGTQPRPVKIRRRTAPPTRHYTVGMLKSIVHDYGGMRCPEYTTPRRRPPRSSQNIKASPTVLDVDTRTSLGVVLSCFFFSSVFLFLSDFVYLVTMAPMIRLANKSAGHSSSAHHQKQSTHNISVRRAHTAGVSRQ